LRRIIVPSTEALVGCFLFKYLFVKLVMISMEEKAIQDRWHEIGSYCWGCGRNNEHGLQLKSYWQGDELVATWQPKEYHIAFPGALVGGIIATLIDCHCVNAANSASCEAEGREYDEAPISGFVGGTITVKYLKPTPIDKPVTLRARIKEMKERKITVTCSLYSGETECATGEVIAVRIGQSKLLG
jgi:acyl-coenzyme A thioesterase PaaI-like protein